MSFDLQDIREMSDRSVLWLAIKTEMIKRGHWKNKNRGINRTKQELQARNFTALSIHSSKQSQVNYDDTQFSE